MISVGQIVAQKQSEQTLAIVGGWSKEGTVVNGSMLTDAVAKIAKLVLLERCHNTQQVTICI